MKTEGFEFELPKFRSAAIKVIGVGGGGSNAVNYMYTQGIEGVDFVVCNTDAQALNNSPVPNKIQLGLTTTEGLGAGANPEIGEEAAIESLDDIKKYLDTNTKMVFVTAGMGGGTGTGAAPVIAETAKKMGILTVGIVTAPFYFEGKMRLEQAEKGIEKMQKMVDSLIVINNDKLRELYGNLGYKTSFAKADEVLTTAAKGIAEVISKHYDTNIDLRDARTVLADSGTAIMGTGRASGENKAKDAILSALDSPLLNNNKISGAQNVLLLIVSGENEITMDEIGIVNEFIQTEAGNNANIIMGVGEDSSLGEDISVTVVATGFPQGDQILTGKEEERIVHPLEDEQPIVQRLSTDTPFPVKVKKDRPVLEDPTPEETALTPKTDLHTEPDQEVRFVLELGETDKKPETPKTEVQESLPDATKEITEESVSEEENTDQETAELFSEPEPEIEEAPELQLEVRTVSEEELPHIEEAAESPVTEQALEEETEEEFPQTILFSLDDDLDELMEEPAAELPKSTITEPELRQETEVKSVEVAEKPAEDSEDPFDKPIPKFISRTIEERRARLKKFNYQFKSSLTKKSVDEIEAVPAYKRKGVDLSEREENNPSEFVVGKDSNDEVKIRPNNFLHDNVD